jgi:hypothetical protein
MKSTFALVWLALVCGACSINHRSGDFSCTKTADCNTGRECVDGFCVVAGTQMIDAPRQMGGSDAHMMNPPDAPACPEECTTCDVGAKTCTIDCEASGSECDGKVTCPAGYTCNIECNADGSCTQGVDCTMAKACTIACSAKSTCDNVVCGPGACDVTCGGRMSCQDVDCSAACQCTVACIGLQVCEGQIACGPDADCLGPNNGCSSMVSATLCNTCP